LGRAVTAPQSAGLLRLRQAEAAPDLYEIRLAMDLLLSVPQSRARYHLISAENGRQVMTGMVSVGWEFCHGLDIYMPVWPGRGI
jgi:hypothetical protein